MTKSWDDWNKRGRLPLAGIDLNAKLDPRQQLLDAAAKTLRDAGCSVVSIMCSWPDGKSLSKISLDAVKVPKRGLGKGLRQIRHEIGAEKKTKVLK